MCTLSVLRRPTPIGDDEPPLWRVTFNRDERRTRPPALPPHQHVYEEHVAVHPIDPLGGGTWIAVSSAGLVFALLNGYSESGARSDAHFDARSGAERPARPQTSRGLIIPTLLGADSLDVATTRVRTLDPTAFLSFRLVIVSDDGACEIVHDGPGGQPEMRNVQEGAVWMRSSSSVRPEAVLPHRRALFEREVAASRLAVVQDRFHLTRHADDAALGVLMEREDARTVSVTTVEVFAARVRMTYRPLEPDAMPAAIDLARQPR